MTRLDTAIRFLQDPQPNPDLQAHSDAFRDRDNAEFFAAVAQELGRIAGKQDKGEPGIDENGVGAFALTGAYGFVPYVIRQAESIIRFDRTPSYWSHCFLIATPLSRDPKVNRSAESAWIWESTLEPAPPFNHTLERNGVGARRLRDYSYAKWDPFKDHCIPNVGVIAIGLWPEEREAILSRASNPDVDQLGYDLAGLLGTWYAYATAQWSHPNPLSSGKAVYCSAYLQLAYDAAGIDLSPGAHQKNTSPEHLWQTARYFHRTLQTRHPKTGKIHARRVYGWYCIRDHVGQVLPLDQGEKLRFMNLRDVLEGGRKGSRGTR